MRVCQWTKARVENRVGGGQVVKGLLTPLPTFCTPNNLFLRRGRNNIQPVYTPELMPMFPSGHPFLMSPSIKFNLQNQFSTSSYTENVLNYND